MTSKRILIVDDESAICSVLADLLEDPCTTIDLVYDGKTALSKATERYDLALLDLSLPGATGLDILKKIKENYPDTPVIIMTAYASIQTAIQAMRQGAYDFITKPFDLDEVQILVERALERKRLIDENYYLKKELKNRYNFDNVVGNNREVQEAFLMSMRVADSNASVLILGETGTGKELLARSIHYGSSRADGPFIKVNCAALPENLLESELFGHEKGAFTNAIARQIGRFELANRGTLFLDEIGDISLATQVKLLRVLQEKQFERVGGSETIKVDVRIVAATNRDLEKALKDGSFRSDLYYRLNVITIRIPPLRERLDDLPELVKHFIQKYSKETGRHIEGISPKGLEILKNYSWPGNIRELENCIERGVILAQSSILQPEDLLLRGGQEGLPSCNQNCESPETGLSLKEMERQYIEKTLNACGWNQSKAAGLLKIDRKTLHSKILEYGLSKSEGS